LRGVYFLANDHVFELAVAFLKSFRYHNPDIALCLIPYDKEFGRISAMRDKYSFSVFDDEELLQACDSISVRFHGRTLGAYRKLVAWAGDFDEFAYIDIDTVVLDSVSFVFDNLVHADIFTSHSDIASIRKYVWKDSIFERAALSERQISFAASTGFFVSSKGVLSMEFISTQTEAALLLKDDMELHCMEQPFLNYLIVTSGCRYGSLSKFKSSGINRHVKNEWWAGLVGGIVEGGTFRTPKNEPIFLVHWAGLWQADNASLSEIPYKNLWDYYRNLELSDLK
jgi:hypothetical protein